MGSDGGVHIFTHKGTQFANCQEMGNQDEELLESGYLTFFFFLKNKDGEEKQGTLEMLFAAKTTQQMGFFSSCDAIPFFLWTDLLLDNRFPHFILEYSRSGVEDSASTSYSIKDRASKRVQPP